MTLKFIYSQKENPEKLATYGTQDEEKQNKNITQYVLIETRTANYEVTVDCDSAYGGGQDGPSMIKVKSNTPGLQPIRYLHDHG